MTRPLDWSPLADVDPAPGDWETVQHLAARLGSVSESVSSQLRDLEDVPDELSWDSDAGRAFAAHARSVADELRKLHSRYGQASAALNSFYPVLRDAQSITLQLLWHAQALVDPAGADAQQLAHLRSRCAESAQLVHDAALRAASCIHTEIGSDGLKDHWTDSIGGWVHHHAPLLKEVSSALSHAAAIAGAAGFLLALVTPVGAVLEGAAVVLSAASLAIDGALARTGDISAAQFGLDFGLFVLSAVGAGELGGAVRVGSFSQLPKAALYSGRTQLRALSRAVTKGVPATERVLITKTAAFFANDAQHSVTGRSLFVAPSPLQKLRLATP